MDNEETEELSEILDEMKHGDNTSAQYADRIEKSVGVVRNKMSARGTDISGVISSARTSLANVRAKATGTESGTIYEAMDAVMTVLDSVQSAFSATDNLMSQMDAAIDSAISQVRNAAGDISGLSDTVRSLGQRVAALERAIPH